MIPPEETSASFIAEHIPKETEVLFKIDDFQVLQQIGKGGMGEVFLAYDPNCGRKIALKKVRVDLIQHKQLQYRFIKEARITSQLTHPAIIPIYSIHLKGNSLYYTMPYVKGETLKQILRVTKKQQSQGVKQHHIGGSIPALIRIFISVCQAVAYAHSKGVLHRDLKPENIIIGPYGEVMILDWGLAKIVHPEAPSSGSEGEEDEETEEATQHPFSGLTRIGKVVGTVSHMAPERAMGQSANIQTDVYALGTILYQILTLKLPFYRGTLKEYRKNIGKEEWIDPSEVAPYRDVPLMLSRIVKKCLMQESEKRYNTVDQLIRDLENYIEGRSEWFEVAQLDITKKEHWEFQENVLIAEHVAITRNVEVSDWVSLMISRASFTENTKIEASIRIGKTCYGIGFLMSVPEVAARTHLNDGYCLWIGSETNKSSKLLRSTVEVMHTNDSYLKCEEWMAVRIEKIDNNIYFYLNDALQFSYISHLPLTGTHIGLISRDADFEIKDFTIFEGGQNVTVNCLAVPDAFLAHKNYSVALSEYRRIGYSFPGRAEGREAMFRAGITLLEQAKASKDSEEKEHLFNCALDEFEKMHDTPGAPLEYLGKSLVYRAQHDFEEEIKCFELACRRYISHPLLSVIHEQIVYRMHETSREHRHATYQFILLAVRHLPDFAASFNSRKLFTSVQKYWEPLPFLFEEKLCLESDWLGRQDFAIKLAFWLNKPYVLEEVIDDLVEHAPFSVTLVSNAIFCLLELGHIEIAKKKLDDITEGAQNLQKERFQKSSDLLRLAILSTKMPLESIFTMFFQIVNSVFSLEQERILIYLIHLAIDRKETALVREMIVKCQKYGFSGEGQFALECVLIWSLLLDHSIREAGEALHAHPLSDLGQETNLLHFLYGCWLYVAEGEEIANIHFSGLLEVSFPRTWNLFSHYYCGRIHPQSDWMSRSFDWEKEQLNRQIALFNICKKNPS